MSPSEWGNLGKKCHMLPGKWGNLEGGWAASPGVVATIWSSAVLRAEWGNLLGQSHVK